MTPTDVKAALHHEVLANGVSLNATAYLVMILGWIVAGALGAFLGAFFGKRGETAAVKSDLETIKESLRQTTKATEEIKADISGTHWLKQKRLDLKWECYAEIVRNLGEIHTIIRKSLALKPDTAEYATKGRAVDDAMIRFRQFGSVARIAVPVSARFVLTRIGDEWNKSTTVKQLGIVARCGWLVITDIARNDLFDEPREMTEFVGDVDLKQP